jgi:hypothetical protein
MPMYNRIPIPIPTSKTLKHTSNSNVITIAQNQNYMQIKVNIDGKSGSCIIPYIKDDFWLVA